MDAPSLSEELADFRRYLEMEFSKLENRLDGFARRLDEMVPAHYAQRENKEQLQANKKPTTQCAPGNITDCFATHERKLRAAGNKKRRTESDYVSL